MKAIDKDTYSIERLIYIYKNKTQFLKWYGIKNINEFLNEDFEKHIFIN